MALKLVNTKPVWLLLREADGTTSDFFINAGVWSVERIPNPAGYASRWIKIKYASEKKVGDIVGYAEMALLGNYPGIVEIIET